MSHIPNQSFKGRGCLLAFLGVWLLGGLLITGTVLWITWKDDFARHWPQVPCVISHSNVKPTENDYQLDLAYQYAVDGVGYQGTKRVLGDDKFSHADQAQAVARHYRPGLKTTCHYNPADKTEAVLKVPSPWRLLWALVPALFTVAVWHFLQMVRRVGDTSVQGAVERQRSSRTSSKAAIRFAGIVFALLGGAGFWVMAVAPLLHARSANTWVPTTCTVDSGRIVSHSGDKGSVTYELVIRYRYEFGGETYLGDRYDFSEGSSSSRTWREEALKVYPAGQSAKCFVNPAAPWESVLVPQAGREWMFGFLPLFFFIVGLGLFFWAPKMRAGATATGLPDTPEASALVARVGLTLAPESTPAVKFGCLSLVAILWNAIVWSVFFVADLKGGAAFIISIFAAVGLLIIGAAVYQFFAMFNPRPVLVVGAQTIRLGDQVEIRYHFDGPASRIVRLFLSVDAREEATYRRGTDSITDRSTFFDAVLLDTRDRGKISRGVLTLFISAALMHTFEAANNKVKWTVRVRADVPHWPDIEYDFPLAVLPQAVPGTQLP